MYCRSVALCIEDTRILGYGTESIGKYIPTFRWTLLPPYSGYEQLKKRMEDLFIVYLNIRAIFGIRKRQMMT